VNRLKVFRLKVEDKRLNESPEIYVEKLEQEKT